jgi:hypothetical protein
MGRRYTSYSQRSTFQPPLRLRSLRVSVRRKTIFGGCGGHLAYDFNLAHDTGV